MLTLGFVFVLAVAPQAPKAPAAPACTILTAQEVASIIGPATPMTVASSPNGSSCMFQNGDKLITVLLTTLSSGDASKGQFEAQKRVMAAKDVAGWPTPAFAGTVDTPKQHVAIVGLMKDLRFVEVKALDLSQKTADLSAKLQTVMKALSGRF